MGSIIKVSEGKYRLFVSAGRGPDGKYLHYSKTVKASSEEQSKKLLRAFEKEVQRDELPLPGNVTFKDLWDLYQRDHVNRSCRPLTQLYYHNCGKRLLAAFGCVKVNAIKPMHISDYFTLLKNPEREIAGLKGGVSDETLRHHYRALRAVLNFGVKYKIIKENPIDAVSLPKSIKPPRKVFTHKELNQVFDALAGEPLKWQALVILDITTGMREEEVAGLKWSDINTEDKIISINRAVQHSKFTGLCVNEGGTKNEDSLRRIEVSDLPLALLKAWKVESYNMLVRRFNRLKNTKIIDKSVVDYLDKLSKRIKDFDNEFIWNQYEGDPMLPHTISTWWRKFIERKKLPKVTFHGLRHTSATITIDKGINIKSVSSRLGHADASTTMRIYAHALQSTDRTIAQMWESILGQNDILHTICTNLSDGGNPLPFENEKAP